MTHTPPPSPTDAVPPYAFLNAPRFQEPPGWRWHHFKATGGYKLRYGSVYPKDSIADAVVVILPGMRDFSEQYLELAHELLEKNFAIWVFDWHGQGDSDRYLPNRHKRHSQGYDRDMRDLQELVEGYILPSAVHPDVGRLPLVMLGHSMGAHVGLRYLRECNISAKGKKSFAAGAFVAPMFWITLLESLPIPLTLLLSAVLNLMPRAYVPTYGRDWTPDYRKQPKMIGRFSHDKLRSQLQEAWFAKKPNLQVGGPTNRWLFETAKSALRLNAPKYLRGIEVPTLIGVAGHDGIVSNARITRAAKHIPETTLVEIPDAEHEILMESDVYRRAFLDHFFSFVDRNVLKKSNRGMTKF